ncbi:MAG: carbamoyltransferase family protein [Gammaproteobacteria bacterium]
MDILGISAFYHDAAAALVRDGIPIAAAQEERFSQLKNDPAFPVRAIRFCLREGQITARELDWVVFYEKPLRKFERILITHLKYYPRSARAFTRAMFLWLGDRLWMKNRIASELGISPNKILFTEHHQSHAASAFFASPFSEAAILTVDGVGEWATTTFGRGNGNDLDIISEIHFPHSLGLLYSAITAFLGFKVNEGEQKVMGLSAYGKPTYLDQLLSLVELDDDGSYEIDISAFRYPYDPDKSFGNKLKALLGDSRTPKQPILFTGENRRHADIAASLQAVLERGLLSLVNELYKQVPSSNLCLAGGVALNVIANSKILEQGPFQHIFIQPAAGDAGGALGAALYVNHVFLNSKRLFVQDHAFFGEAINLEQNTSSNEISNEDKLIDEVVSNLINGKTVGWVQGRFEWGPRSLGHRSLLADPRNPKMKNHINQQIKHRENFRPFAPSITKEFADQYFDMPAGSDFPTKFMLLSVPVLDKCADKIPAALHIDNTGRIQVVDHKIDPLFHKLITRFGEETGVPVLLNTSLNLQGEPIVRGEKEAVSVLKRSGMDMLVVENRIYT